MYCRNCGAMNDETSLNCLQCGKTLQLAAGYRAPININSHLVLAILVTLFCCVPFGIVSIVYAAQVNSKLQAGDYQGAMDYSKKASWWGWLGFGTGLLWIIIWITISFDVHYFQ